jgi:hypothetical protein
MLKLSVELLLLHVQLYLGPIYLGAYVGVLSIGPWLSSFLQKSRLTLECSSSNSNMRHLQAVAL